MKVQTDVEVNWQCGLHIRPATLIAQTAKQYYADIIIYKDNMKVNAKSPMQILTLEAIRGTRLTLEAEGKDAEAAIEALATLFSSAPDRHEIVDL